MKPKGSRVKVKNVWDHQLVCCLEANGLSRVHCPFCLQQSSKLLLGNTLDFQWKLSWTTQKANSGHCMQQTWTTIFHPVTLSKFDMEPKNAGFQKESPMPGCDFRVNHVVLWDTLGGYVYFHHFHHPSLHLFMWSFAIFLDIEAIKWSYMLNLSSHVTKYLGLDRANDSGHKQIHQLFLTNLITYS